MLQNPVFRRLIVICICLLPLGALAQKGRSPQADPVVLQQAGAIKQHYLNQGFEVMNEASFPMESNAPLPIVTRLQRGHMYQIIFVGIPNANKLRIDIHNGHQQKIDEKLAMANREQPSWLTFPYVPEQTDNYMFVMFQKLKKTKLSGSFVILKLKPTDKPVAIVPYAAEPAP